MEAYNFAVASEDHNGYIFDMRNMKRALQVLVSPLSKPTFTRKHLLTPNRKGMSQQSCRSSSPPLARNSSLAVTIRLSDCGSAKKAILAILTIQSGCSASSPWPGVPTTTTFSADLMTAMFACGAQGRPNDAASSHLPCDRNFNMKKHSWSDTSTCQRSSAFTSIGIFLRRSRRLVRSRMRNSSLLRGRRKMKGDIQRRVRSDEELSVKR